MMAAGQDKAQDAPAKVTANVANILADGESVNAGTLAALIRDPLGAHRWALGRATVNDKRVRSVAREQIVRLNAENRTGYTPHAYSQAEADMIVAAMAASGGRGTGQSATALRERVKGTVKA